MTKPDFLRRFFLGCFTITPTTPNTTTTTTLPTTTKKRLSTSLRDDIIIPTSPSCSSPVSNSNSDDNIRMISHQFAPPRASKSMVICTFFGRRGASHVWFCVQINRVSPKPSLLLELSLSTRDLVKEMQCGLLRIALDCKNNFEFSSCPLHLVPLWTMFCNGRRVGFATCRKANLETRDMLKKMQNITMGAGVIAAPAARMKEEEEETRPDLMYMRANYEWVIGGADSESFHLISPNECPGQELSVFLLRSS